MGTIVTLSTDWGEVMEKHPLRGKDGKGKVLWMINPQEGFLERCGMCASFRRMFDREQEEKMGRFRRPLSPAPHAPSDASLVGNGCFKRRLNVSEKRRENN